MAAYRNKAINQALWFGTCVTVLFKGYAKFSENEEENEEELGAGARLR